MKLTAVKTPDKQLRITITAHDARESSDLAYIARLLNERGTIGLDELGSYSEHSCPGPVRPRTAIELLIDKACGKGGSL